MSGLTAAPPPEPLQPNQGVVSALKAQLEAAEKGEIRSLALVATMPDGRVFTQLVTATSPFEMVGLTSFLHSRALAVLEVTGG